MINVYFKDKSCIILLIKDVNSVKEVFENIPNDAEKNMSAKFQNKFMYGFLSFYLMFDEVPYTIGKGITISNSIMSGEDTEEFRWRKKVYFVLK